MQIATEFHQLEVSPALSEFIERRLNTLKRRFARWGDGLKIRVNVDLANRRATGTPKSFHVLAEVIRPKSKPFIVQKTDKDVRKALLAALGSLERMAERDRTNRNRGRKCDKRDTPV
jgi:ribosome-associated translation inhibitor RaiA